MNMVSQNLWRSVRIQGGQSVFKLDGQNSDLTVRTQIVRIQSFRILFCMYMQIDDIGLFSMLFQLIVLILRMSLRAYEGEEKDRGG